MHQRRKRREAGKRTRMGTTRARRWWRRRIGSWNLRSPCCDRQRRDMKKELHQEAERAMSKGRSEEEEEKEEEEEEEEEGGGEGGTGAEEEKEE